MARNGSGTYTRVAGTPYVYNTVIDQDVVNNEMDDVATALTASIAKDGQTTPTANLPMGTYRHTGVGAAAARTDYARAAEVQDGSITHLTSVSGADTITASAGLSMSAYAAGQKFSLVSAGANTGAVTLNINSIGAKAITKNGTTALAAGDIPSGAAVQVVYDGTQFQLTGARTTASDNTWTGTQTFRDNKFEITDDSDTTKKLAFQCSGITTATTRTVTVPDKSGTMAMTSDLVYKVVQRVEATPNTTYASDAAGSLPLDNTIPQKTEGAAYVTQSFTPLYSDSILVIEGLACVGGNGANTIGVFIADTAINDALAATAVTVGGASYQAAQPVRAVVSAASTSARTYELRIGAAGGVTFFVNGTTSARLFGGAMGCRLSITEFRPS